MVGVDLQANKQRTPPTAWFEANTCVVWNRPNADVIIMLRCCPYSLLLSPLLLILCWMHTPALANVQCQSCFSDCRTGANGRIDPNNCDCQGDTCSGPYCFVKIEIFPEEYTAVVQVSLVRSLSVCRVC